MSKIRSNRWTIPGRVFASPAGEPGLYQREHCMKNAQHLLPQEFSTNRGTSQSIANRNSQVIEPYWTVVINSAYLLQMKIG